MCKRSAPFPVTPAHHVTPDERGLSVYTAWPAKRRGFEGLAQAGDWGDHLL